MTTRIRNGHLERVDRNLDHAGRAKANERARQRYAEKRAAKAAAATRKAKR